MRNTETTSNTIPPAAEAFAASAELKRAEMDTGAATVTGGIDYSREKEITEDEMTDELFAAVKRGDETKAIGLTTSRNPRRSNRMSTGAMQIASKAHDIKQAMESEGTVRGFAYGDIGITAALLAQTNGNVALAKLLYAQLKTNDLQQMGGMHADDMAREIGAYGLSQSIQQVQREDAIIAEATAEAATQSKFAGMWSKLFGGDAAEASPIVVSPIAAITPVAEIEAAPTTMMGMVGCSLKKGLSGICGMFASKAEASAPVLSMQAVMAKNVMHLAPKMA